ncbi:MAG: heavy-metal-associated domain-containing protein [Bacteroidota bacterium]|nr:heavy-metal-associated domain-containing protein [Bacteroidota bacterium]
MKSFILGIFALTAFSTASVAQNNAIQKAVIQTPGVQIEACKTSIENFLAHEYGVAYVKADYRRHTVTVKWFKDRTNIENIKTALANMGYDADDVTAEPDAFKRLQAACKPPVVNKNQTKEK